jgi:hypothetical protein
MLKSTDPIARSCFGGIESSISSFSNVSVTNGTQVSNAFTNFGLNLGKVLTAVKDITLFFADTVYASNDNTTMDAGRSVGVIISSFFTEPPLKGANDTAEEEDFWGEDR